MSDEELIQACLQDELTAEQAEALSRRLDSDPDFRTRLLDAAQVEGLLRAHYAPEEMDVAMERRTLGALASPEQERKTEQAVLARIQGVRRRAHDQVRRRAQPMSVSPLRVLLPLASAAALMMIVWSYRSTFVPSSDTGLAVAEVQGGVERVSGQVASPLSQGARIQPGDVVRTASDGTAMLRFADGSELVLMGGSEVAFTRIEKGKQLRLAKGLMKARVAPQPNQEPMCLSTAQAQVTVVGTEFSLGVSDGTCRLEVDEGTVRMATAEGEASVEVRGGEYAETRGSPADLVHRPLPRRLNALVGPALERRMEQTKVTYFVSPEGNDDRDGRTRQTAFATLQKATDVVQPGETVLALQGVYKEGFWIHKEGRKDAWITVMAEPGAEIRGSDVRKDFTRVPGDAPVYCIPRPELFPGWWQKPDVPLYNRPEQVFVNGVLLRQVTDPAMLKPKNVFYVDDDTKKLYVCLEAGKDPNQESTEVTMRTHAISIGGPPNSNWWPEPEMSEKNRTAYVRIDGFRIRHIGNFSRHAAIQVRGLCHDVVVQNCDVQQINHHGIAVSGFERRSEKTGQWFRPRPHHITIRNCISSHNGVQGIGGGGFDDCVFEFNLLDGNNYKGVSPWSEGGAIKLLECTNIVIRGNVARGNDNHGIWYDYADTGCVIENNLVFNSVAGGILDEVTPRPPSVVNGNEMTHKPFTADEARAAHQTGTLIRNNVILNTRTPGGGGVNISNSTDTRVVNNIFAFNTGGGINIGGSPTRAGTNGLYNNEARSNICYANFLHATVLKDEDDKSGRFFNNTIRDNLFLQAQSDPPFRISGKPATAEEFKAFNKGAENYVDERSIFKDPEHWDFTIVDEALAKKIGFDPKALRLDWSEFWVKPEETKGGKEARDFTPVDLSGVFNRALSDEIPGDGQGGWTDQGRNDMSLLPLGRRTLDGILFQIGPAEKGVLLLATDKVKPGGFPESTSVPVNGSFSELYFLYAAAWADSGEKARFTVVYDDRTTQEIPVVVGTQVLDWWTDPTWQQYAALNDHGVYVAWQGPNRDVGKVTLYYLKWANPDPKKQIASVHISNRNTKSKCAFLLLSITGANPPAQGTVDAQLDSGEVLRWTFDGDIDAVGTKGEIEAGGFNRAAFDAGVFDEGRKGKAFVVARESKKLSAAGFHCAEPADFPNGPQGAISLWLQAEEWRGRVKDLKPDDYRRVMWPFQSRKVNVQFHCRPEGERLFVDVMTPGAGGREEVTERVKPGEWFNLTASWGPMPGQPEKVQRVVYFNGKPLGSPKIFNAPKPEAGQQITIGRPENGGQPWYGAMDEFRVWNRELSAAEVEKIAAGE